MLIRRTLIVNIDNLPTDTTLHPPTPPVPSALFPDVVPDAQGNSRLHIAARAAKDAVVLKLLQDDVERLALHARNHAGLTPLHLACLQTMFKEASVQSERSKITTDVDDTEFDNDSTSARFWVCFFVDRFVHH